MTPLALLALMGLVTVALRFCAVTQARRVEVERQYNEFRAFVFQTEANLLRRRQERPKRSAAAHRGHLRRKGSAWKTDPILRSTYGA